MDLINRILLIGTAGKPKVRQKLARTPTITVVIPCYNYGRFLEQCVRSVLTDQPGVLIDVIIVDDKSTDDSLTTAREIARSEPRVKIIEHLGNKGHIATYNDGLNAATGEFVLLISADDVVTPGALTRAAELLVSDETIGLVYGRCVPFYSELPKPRTIGKSWIIWSGRDWFALRCRSGYNVVASPEVIVRSSLLRQIGGYRPELPHAGDFEMWLRIAAVSNIGYLVGVDQAYYRQHAVNMNATVFSSGTPRGQLTDLRQRWQSFETVFLGVGGKLANAMELRSIARRTLAGHALKLANYAYARGLKHFPVFESEALACQIDPDVLSSMVGRAFQRRKRMGMSSLPLHPLWAASAVGWRVEEFARRWRRARVGV